MLSYRKGKMSLDQIVEVRLLPPPTRKKPTARTSSELLLLRVDFKVLLVYVRIRARGTEM